MKDDALAQLRAIFREEAGETLETLATLFDRLSRAPSAASAGALTEEGMRHAHNLKGAAASVGATEIARVAHALEDVLVACPALPEAASRELLATGLQLLQRAVEGSASAAEVDAYAARAPSAARVLPPRRRRTTPPVAAATVRRSPRPPTIPTPRPTHPPAATGEPPATRTTIRVEAARFDKLLAFAAELLAAEASLHARHAALDGFLEDLRHQRSKLGPAGLDLERKFGRIVGANRRAVDSFSHLSRDLHAAMRGARMMPIAQLGPVWQRALRDSARQVGKRVSLELDVGAIELDRVVLERLREPIVHLLRNAADHGIEAADVRELRGKPADGLVVVRAELTGSLVRVEVSDDGRGLNLERIGQVAIERGVEEASAVARMTREELCELVFRAGFSTASQVSQVSGRGVGLDLVRRAVEEIGGRVELVPRASIGGATFALTVPLSVLSTRGLLVRAGRGIYAMPLAAIERIARVRRSDVKEHDGAAVVELGGELLRVRWLALVMGQEATGDSPYLRIAIAGKGRARVGLVVDDILDDAELVVLKLPWNVGEVRGVTGAALLADGSVAAVLDPSQVVTRARDRSAAAMPAPTRARRVLVVDDSLTSRTLHRNVLVGAGHDVVTAADGVEAWSILQREEVHLVVSDVQMPGLTGFDLTRRIRRDPRLAHVPVVLVTSLSREDDLREGVEAGADEYVVKGLLEQEKLLEAVARQL